MTHALVTVDTELSSSRQAAGLSARDNLAVSITGRTGSGDFGVGWQMDRMDEQGIKGVYFVDPMPGLVHGPDIVAEMVEPILARGHEVQLHIHTEWLEWAKVSPVEGRTGRNIGDFDRADQIALIGWARDALVTAGVPAPTAFRAGNFGANDDTLAALAALGIGWDSSFNADYAGRDCRISLPAETVEPVALDAVWEAPVAGIWDMPGHFRPAQVCALSAWEMRAGLGHAATTRAHSFVVVTHSFEMLSRDRQRPNPAVMKRFTALCADIARIPGLSPRGFATLPAPVAGHNPGRLPASRIRTLARVAEQALATLRHEKRPLPL